MFYCACRSYFVPCRTWLILLAKCIWSAWPSSIIFLVAACEWALYYYFFHLFNYQMCLPIPGISAPSKSKPQRWPPVWSTLLLCRPPPSLTTPASPAPISCWNPRRFPLPLGILACPSACLPFSSLTFPVAPSHPPGLCLREAFLDHFLV